MNAYLGTNVICDIWFRKTYRSCIIFGKTLSYSETVKKKVAGVDKRKYRYFVLLPDFQRTFLKKRNCGKSMRDARRTIKRLCKKCVSKISWSHAFNFHVRSVAQRDKSNYAIFFSRKKKELSKNCKNRSVSYSEIKELLQFQRTTFTSVLEVNFKPIIY